MKAYLKWFRRHRKPVRMDYRDELVLIGPDKRKHRLVLTQITVGEGGTFAQFSSLERVMDYTYLKPRAKK